jgi:Phage portal protein
MPTLKDRFRNAWNAFQKTLQPEPAAVGVGSTSGVYFGMPPQRMRIPIYNERSIIASIYTRIAMDVSALMIKHVMVDAQGRYSKDLQTPLQTCLTFEANIDQAPRAFRQDIVMSMFTQGVAAIVPVDTSRNPDNNDIFDIYSLRVGEVVTWYPRHVRVNVYNDQPGHGKREEITLEKRYVALAENPLYSVMNETNSTLQRLLRKLALLDSVDEASASGKLDLIIQLPYVVKSEARRQQAVSRREDIEFQLRGSQYGIAYIDGTEKITQLNRPAENQLLAQVEYLTKVLYNELGLTEAVMNGTADETAMINYYNRTVWPIVTAIIEAMQRAFLGPQGISNDERISFFRDPFGLVPVKDMAEIADKLARNEIVTANEVRQGLGLQPSSDPHADELRNSNMPQPEVKPAEAGSPERIQNGSGS